MTSNTYNKVKNKDNTLAQPTQRKTKAAQRDEAVLGRNATVTSGSESAQKVTTHTGNTALVRKRKKVHTKPKAIHTRIPAILGFDTREKFITKAATTVNRYPLALGIAIIALVTSMFMMVVVNAVNINKLKLETTQMNGSLAELIEKEAELSLELEKRDDLRYIREVALNQYGMIDKKHVTKYYISLDKDPKVEVIDKETDSEPIVDGAAD